MPFDIPDTHAFIRCTAAVAILPNIRRKNHRDIDGTSALRFEDIALCVAKPLESSVLKCRHNNRYVTRLGFKKNNIELCLYTHAEGKNVVYLLIYVDDLLICSKNKSVKKIQSVQKLLTNKFEMKDLGEVKEYLGINIDYDCFKNEMRLSQNKYIESLANKYKLQNSKLHCTLMETNLKIEKAEINREDIGYKNLIGALLYVATLDLGNFQRFRGTRRFILKALCRRALGVIDIPTAPSPNFRETAHVAVVADF